MCKAQTKTLGTSCVSENLLPRLGEPKDAAGPLNLRARGTAPGAEEKRYGGTSLMLPPARRSSRSARVAPQRQTAREFGITRRRQPIGLPEQPGDADDIAPRAVQAFDFDFAVPRRAARISRDAQVHAIER